MRLEWKHLLMSIISNFTTVMSGVSVAKAIATNVFNSSFLNKYKLLITQFN